MKKDVLEHPSSSPHTNSTTHSTVGLGSFSLQQSYGSIFPCQILALANAERTADFCQTTETPPSFSALSISYQILMRTT